MFAGAVTVVHCWKSRNQPMGNTARRAYDKSFGLSPKTGWNRFLYCTGSVNATVASCYSCIDKTRAVNSTVVGTACHFGFRFNAFFCAQTRQAQLRR